MDLYTTSFNLPRSYNNNSSSSSATILFAVDASPNPTSAQTNFTYDSPADPAAPAAPLQPAPRSSQQPLSAPPLSAAPKLPSVEAQAQHQPVQPSQRPQRSHGPHRSSSSFSAAAPAFRPHGGHAGLTERASSASLRSAALGRTGATNGGHGSQIAEEGTGVVVAGARDSLDRASVVTSASGGDVHGDASSVSSGTGTGTGTGTTAPSSAFPSAKNSSEEPRVPQLHVDPSPAAADHNPAAPSSAPASTSVSPPRIESDDGGAASTEEDLIESMRKLTGEVMSNHQCLITFDKVDPVAQREAQQAHLQAMAAQVQAAAQAQQQAQQRPYAFHSQMSAVPVPVPAGHSPGLHPAQAVVGPHGWNGHQYPYHPPLPTTGVVASQGSPSLNASPYSYHHSLGTPSSQHSTLSPAPATGASGFSYGPIGGSGAPTTPATSVGGGVPFPSMGGAAGAPFGAPVMPRSQRSSFSTPASVNVPLPSHASHHHHPPYGLGVTGATAPSSGPGAQVDVANANLSKQPPKFNFHLSGGYQQVMSARGALLRDSPFKTKSVVRVARADLIESVPARAHDSGSGDPAEGHRSSPGRNSPSTRGGASAGNNVDSLPSPSPPRTDFSSSTVERLKPSVQERLDEIALSTHAHLSVVGTDAGGTDLGNGLETERTVEIVVTGSYESVEQARVQVLVLLDELSGLHSDTCEIDYKLHNIVSGRKRCVIQTIQEETATNIYLPTPLSGVLGSTRNPGVLAKQNTIYITGEFFGVQRAREMLFQVSMHKSNCIISRDTAILPRKLDWMLTDRLEEIKTVMHDNGTFINFPIIGSQASLISVYGDHRVNIERTIRSIMQLACQFYVASFWLLPVSFDVFMSSASLNPAQMASLVKRMSSVSGAEVVYKHNCFEMHGLESEVRMAVQMVLELDVVKAFHHEIRFQIELANEHRDFISGKKNGKINKIMKSANVKIKFETFNDYNFLIDVAGSDVGALQGLTMLQEELPAEVSFHVPEAYHKRIIGVGGKNIQRIMKKYGVYVKFSNAEEFAALGGYMDNEDNVIARTPAKNAVNLENLKQSVMELVNPKDKDYMVETVSIPRRYHRTLLGEKSIFIHDIEAKTNSIVRFPNKETASDVVTIFGPESQVHMAAQMLLDHVPFEAEYRTPYSADLAQLVLANDFVALTERIKRELQIIVIPLVRQPQHGEAVFRFRLNRSNTDFLATTKDLLEDFLVSRNVAVFPSSDRSRADSFAHAFPHFNSKLLSTVAAEAGDTMPETSRFMDRKLRAANSTPDIKALFDSPSYTYTSSATSPLHSHFLPPKTSDASSSSPAKPPGFTDLWSGYPLQPAPPSRAVDDHGLYRHRTEAYNEEKLSALRKPRSFSNRAHSLDIGALSSQQAAAAAAAAAAASNNSAIGLASTGGGGGYPSATAAGGGPGFVGGHVSANPSISYGHGRSYLGQSSTMAPSGMPDSINEVSRILEQLAFDPTPRYG